VGYEVDSAWMDGVVLNDKSLLGRKPQDAAVGRRYGVEHRSVRHVTDSDVEHSATCYHERMEEMLGEQSAT